LQPNNFAALLKQLLFFAFSTYLCVCPQCVILSRLDLERF